MWHESKVPYWKDTCRTAEEREGGKLKKGLVGEVITDGSGMRHLLLYED
jgi:hypothetical protein